MAITGQIQAFENAIKMDDIIQLKITLEGTKPAIWRRIQVEKNTTFFEVHHIIQIAFGWLNYHMYQFNVDGYHLGEPAYKMQDVDSDADIVIDSRDITIESLIVEPGEKFEYEYDFGDGWSHQIVVEKFLPGIKRKQYPTCTAGKLACPPEDSGGLRGFYDNLEIIKNKKHPENKDTKRWLGGGYDPAYFDKKLVNKELSTLDKYIYD